MWYPGAPQHAAQRENRREDVFSAEPDREVYLRYLAEYGRKHAFDIYVGRPFGSLQVKVRVAEEGPVAWEIGFAKAP